MGLMPVWVRALSAALALVTASACRADDWIVDDQGCKVWRPEPVPNEAVQWSGACRDGWAEGKGILIWTTDGQTAWTYEGDMKAGRYSGQGVLATPRGLRYEGGFAEGLYSGQGTLTHPDGGVQRGEFVAGSLDGTCTVTWPEGDQYQGQCKDGHPKGAGRIRFRNGDAYDGSHNYGQPWGQGRYRWAGGDAYQGSLKEGKPWGQGEYRFSNGSRYAGEFSDGLPSGRGRVQQRDGLGYAGKFESGHPVAPGAFFKTGAPAPKDSLQLRMQLALGYAQVRQLPTNRRFGSPEDLCRLMPPPELPPVNWQGEALYRVIGAIHDGRVVEIDVTSLRPGVDPVAERAFVASIEKALQSYQCQGDHVFEQEFQFVVE